MRVKVNLLNGDFFYRGLPKNIRFNPWKKKEFPKRFKTFNKKFIVDNSYDFLFIAIIFSIIFLGSLILGFKKFSLIGFVIILFYCILTLFKKRRLHYFEDEDADYCSDRYRLNYDEPYKK